MTALPSDWRPRTVVCGTNFGRIYLAAFRLPDMPFELAGIIARGSDRSRACAREYAVPLYTNVEDVPDDIAVACVVVGGAANGGEGAELAVKLVSRGIHVLQEHPLHHDELAHCLLAAHRKGVVYRLNTHQVHVEPVVRFLQVARELARRQHLLFVDAYCSFQTLYTLLDILGEALGGVRPWAFGGVSRLPDDVRALMDVEPAFRQIEGVIRGLPLTLRVQNQLDPADPNNFSHLFHRITIGSEGGNITLVNTHGPVVWCPRPHMPSDSRDAVRIEHSAEAHLGYPSAATIGPTVAPDYREILGSVWPTAVRRALLGVRRAVIEREDPRGHGQYQLTLCRLWHDLSSRLGPPTLRRCQAPRVLSADAIALEVGR